MILITSTMTWIFLINFNIFFIIVRDISHPSYILMSGALFVVLLKLLVLIRTMKFAIIIIVNWIVRIFYIGRMNVFYSVRRPRNFNLFLLFRCFYSWSWNWSFDITERFKIFDLSIILDYHFRCFSFGLLNHLFQETDSFLIDWTISTFFVALLS